MNVLDDILGKPAKNIEEKKPGLVSESPSNKPIVRQPEETKPLVDWNKEGAIHTSSAKQFTPPSLQQEKPNDDVSITPPLEPSDKKPQGLDREMSYEEMYKHLNPFQPQTAEEMERERKKERRQKLFASIGDGISALANLYFTTKGAPNMYSPESSSARQVENKWQRIKDERQAQMQAYVRGLIQAKQADDEWRHRLGIDTYNRELKEKELEFKENKDKRDADLYKLELLLKRGKISEQEAKARKADIEAKYAGGIQQSIMNRNNAAAGASKASAENSRASAEERRASADSKKQFVAYDKHGNAHVFSSKDAANYFAQQQGTFVPTTATTTNTTTEGRRSKEQTTSKPSGGYSRKPISEKKANPMAGNNGSGNKKNPMS